mgnify:FL=1
MQSQTRGAAIMAAAALVLGTAACGSPGGLSAADRDSADEATVLTLATAGGPDGRSAAQVREFASQVEELSGGSIRIQLVLKAASDEAGAWDQAVAQSTEGGDFDMALIPTRTWEAEGVRSFTALSAPFLRASDQAVAKIVAPELASSMMAGLKSIGLSGLALLLDRPRMIFSFDGPVLKPADLAGKVVRTPGSGTGNAALRALGASPQSLAGGLFTDALNTGAVTAAESSFARASSFPRPSTTTGNLPLYVKVNSLVVNTKTYTHLAADDRRILMEAAGKTRESMTQSMLRTADEAAAYCRNGGTIVAATEAQLAAFEAAAAPVYAQLEKDSLTRSLLAKIRALTAAPGGTFAVAPCSPGT